MSAGQLPVDNIPEWKPLPIWFPVNSFLQPLPITFVNILLGSWTFPLPTPHNNLDLVLDSMEGMLLLVYHQDLLQFNPPSLSAITVLLPKSWDMTHTSIRPHCLTSTFIEPDFFLGKYSIVKKWRFSPEHGLRNSQESDSSDHQTDS